MDTLLASQLVGRKASPHPLLVEYLRRHDVCDQIIEKGFCEVPWGDLRPLFTQAQNGLARLINEETEKRRRAFRVPEDRWEYDEIGEELEAGLLIKRKGNKKKRLSILEAGEKRLRFDGNKYRFHYHPNILLRYIEEHNASLISEYADMLGPCAIMNAAGFNLALAMSFLFDELNLSRRPTLRYPGSLLEQTRKSLAITRLLQYQVALKFSVDAVVHRDRGCWTMHWLSSDPGLVLFDHNGKALSAHEDDPERILIFPSVKFWAITRELFGLGAFHGAKDARRDGRSQMKTAMRYVAVTFAHAALSSRDVSWLTAHSKDPRLDISRYPL